jgi:glycosyltransferase involved in cell wall biosynthesis
MRIVQVSPHFPPDHIGGVERYVERLAGDLCRQGDEPVIICVEHVDSTAAGVTSVRDDRNGYPIHRLHINPRLFDSPLSAAYDVPAVETVVGEILDSTTPDVVHLHSGYLFGAAALRAAERRNIPTVVTLHDFWFICPLINMVHPSGEPCTGPDNAAKCAWCVATMKRRYRLADRLTGRRLGRLVNAIGRNRYLRRLTTRVSRVRSLGARHLALTEALSGSHVILSPARFVRDRIIEAGVPSARVFVSRIGISARDVARADRPRDGALRIGYLGQLAPHKGVHVLIDSLGFLPGASLVLKIFGDPTPHPAYVRRLRNAARTDSRIDFKGPYRYDTVYDILSALDLVVMPSICHETGPLVIREAQAAHVPVIASRLGGPLEIVSEQRDGLLFEPGDARDLADRIRTLIQDPARLEELTPDGSSVRTTADEMRELNEWYRRLSRGESLHGPQL